MNLAMTLLLPAAALALISLPLITAIRGVKTPNQARRRVIGNLCMFFGVCLCAVLFPVSALAETGAVASIIGTNAQGMGFLAAAAVTGLAAIGAGIAVAAAAPAAIGAVSEDPKSFGKAIIFVVLGEGIAIYGLLISILIINKL